jgi:hypothetical protein
MESRIENMHSTLYIIGACGVTFVAAFLLATVCISFMLAHIGQALPESYNGIRQNTAGALLAVCVAFGTTVFVFAGLMS